MLSVVVCFAARFRWGATSLDGLVVLIEGTGDQGDHEAHSDERPYRTENGGHDLEGRARSGEAENADDVSADEGPNDRPDHHGHGDTEADGCLRRDQSEDRTDDETGGQSEPASSEGPTDEAAEPDAPDDRCCVVRAQLVPPSPCRFLRGAGSGVAAPIAAADRLPQARTVTTTAMAPTNNAPGSGVASVAGIANPGMTRRNPQSPPM